ncbi:hypothetical protein [Pacificoceanicola onchidii]|uniref:hypothetical protein n=1 Tax=Pacificoceanicola onchidii TaxID=2562685 RepID=UPI0010A5BD20|nr:hypothetical protein [Pacificoceanicola onchidii]
MAANYIAGMIGTFGLAIAAILWLDFHEQAIEARVSSEDYSIGQWMGTFVSRGQSVVRRGAMMVNLGGSLNSYFPDTTSGWHRRAWSPSYEQALHKVRSMSGDLTDDQIGIRDDPLGWAEENAERALKGAYDKSPKSRAAVYVKGDKVLVLTARYAKANPLSQTERWQAKAMQYEFRDGKLARSFGGYAFHYLKSFGWQHELSGKGYRLRASMGGELELIVVTNAPLSQASQVLASIDYAGLGSVVGISEEDAQARQGELNAQLERQTREAQQKQARIQADIERRLASKARRARGSGVQEVCITQGGQNYCAWVDN